MAPRESRAAVEGRLRHLRRVAQCVTEQPIAVVHRPAPRLPYFSFLPRSALAPLDRGGARVWLRFEQEFRPAQNDAGPDAVDVQLLGDRYQLLGTEEQEVLAYHWHPLGVSPFTDPHLRLSGSLAPLDLGGGAAPARLGKMHLPTGGHVGLVTLADIVRLLIAEFAVEPRRPDWARIVAEADA